MPIAAFSILLCLAPVFAQTNIPVFNRVSSDPVLRPTASWEGSEISKESLLYDEGKYKMWYGGYVASTKQSAIGYATSNDGMNWTKYDGNPILPDFSAPTVVKVQGTYYMYYTYYDQKHTIHIGLSTSTDGINWVSYEGNPLPLHGPSPSSVLWANDRWMMWIHTVILTPPFTQVTAYANSSDGKVWKEISNPVKLPLPPEYSDVSDVTVVFAGGLYNMWAILASRSQGFRMFYYTSTNGLNWTLSDQNPLSGETRPVDYPFVIPGGTLSYLWYNSQNSGVYSIYLATSTMPIPEFAFELHSNLVVVTVFSVLALQFAFPRKKIRDS